MEVIGIKDVNFKAKDGGTVQGVRLFVTDDSVKVNAGVACEAIFLSDYLLDKNNLRSGDIHVGDHLDIAYNKYGKISFVGVG